MEWNAQDCYISKAVKDTSMLSSKVNQMKVSQETGSEAFFQISEFGKALRPFTDFTTHQTKILQWESFWWFLLEVSVPSE